MCQFRRGLLSPIIVYPWKEIAWREESFRMDCLTPGHCSVNSEHPLYCELLIWLKQAEDISVLHSFKICLNQVHIRQHCRITLCKTYGSRYRRNTHQHQRVSVSEQKIPIIILILRWGPCLVRLVRLVHQILDHLRPGDSHCSQSCQPNPLNKY